MKKNYIILFLFLISINLFSQSFNQDSIAEVEDSLKLMFDKMGKMKDDNQKQIVNNQIIITFSNILKHAISFDYQYSALKTISILKSPNGLLKIYNWNIALSNGTYEYYGFIQYKHKKKKIMLVFQLHDKSATFSNPENIICNHENWFGALYYQLIEKKDDNKVYYTLIGWDGNTIFSNKKIIDVLLFSSNGKPVFGAPLFKIGEGRVKRLIFEYSKQAQMLLKYDEKHDMIVMDHLSPAEPKLKGQFQFYGPDWSYDALEFKKGKWLYIPDIDARNPKEKANKREHKFSY